MVWLINTFWALKRRVSEALYLWRSSPDDNFEYSPLSTDPATAPIRLLDLEDGGHGDILRCRLYHADLNDDLPLTEYEAVSYSWNRNIIRNRVVVVLSRLVPGLRWQEYSVEEASPSRLLVCNGRVLKIQPNLYDFLVRLRAQRRHCSLWIDAICINQDEANEQARIEKHSRILRMSRIYAAAIRVLVWLGESSGSHMAALPDFLTGLPTLKQSQDENFRTRHQISHFRSPDARSVVRVIVQTLDLRDSLWHTLWNMQRRLHYVRQLTLLANREYFRRMWVVQELFFARELAFFTGSVQLSWDAIVKGQQIVEAFSTTSELVSDPLRHRGLLTLPHVVASGKKRRDRGGQGDHDLQSHWSLDDILFLLRDHVATRPEDKVLSILGLIDVATAEEVTAGVMDQGSVRLDQLYYNCATAIARDRGWPYILTLVALGAAEDTRLPSWIPNFQQPMLPKPFWYFGCEDFAVRTAQRSPNLSVRATTRGQIHTATDNSSTKSTGASDTGLPDYTVNTSPSWTLTVPLITFSTIVQVGESHSELDETQSNRMQGHIFDLLTRLGQRYTPTGELTLDALMRTLTADVFNQREDPMTERRKGSLRAEFYTWLAATFNLIETPTLPGTSTIYDMRARQFGVSTQRDTPSINGYDIDRTACIDAFVSMHNSAVYPVSKLFLRPETTKPWIPEVMHQPEPGDEEANTFWMTGGFTLDKAVDWAVRYLDFKVNGLHNAIDQVYRDCRVFRTGSGHLGSGPKNIRLGDVVCFVAGAQTPFVFRRVGQSGLGSRVSIGGQPVPLAVDLGQVRVVGAAYVHGVMHKEFIEGLAGSSFAGVSVV